MANMNYADPTQIFEDLASKYRKGALRLLSSKYFLACRVVILCAFRGDFSREIDDDDLTAVATTVIRQLSNIDDSSVPGQGLSQRQRVAKLRDVCIDNGYLFSTIPHIGEKPKWRVTPDARRAFSACDALSEDSATNFNSARLEMIMTQLAQVEIDLTPSGKEQAAKIQRQIDELIKRRDESNMGTARKLTAEEAIDHLEQLYAIMRDLPTDVEAIAFSVQQKTTELTHSIDERVRTLAENLTEFSRESFDLLTTSDEGRSYVDALRIMTTDEISEITDRLKALEATDIVAGKIPRGYLSGAWDDLMRAIAHVQTSNREGTSVVMRAAVRSTSRMGRDGVNKRARALAALSGNVNDETLRILVPWQYPVLANDVKLVQRPHGEYSQASIGEAQKIDPSTIDHARLVALAGPSVTERLQEIEDATFNLAPEDHIHVSEVVSTLPDTSRRLVEWTGLIDAVMRAGGIRRDDVQWHLVDVNKTPCTWTGPEMVIRKSDLTSALQERKLTKRP